MLQSWTTGSLGLFNTFAEAVGDTAWERDANWNPDAPFLTHDLKPQSTHTMLQSFDTLVAFITVLTICSLFVLIFVQMIAAALSLRGKNMANALALTFQTIDSTLGSKAHQLAQTILSDPLLSDSMLKSKDRTNESVGTRTSEWSAAGVFNKAMHLGNAIRPEEIYAALKKLSETDGHSLKSQATTLLTAIAKPSPEMDLWKKKIEALASLADATVNPTAKAAITDAITRASSEMVKNLEEIKDQLHSWFDAAQDRAEQWFQTHTRTITIVVSILVVAICQLDAVEIFQRVSTDPATRQALLNASSEVVKSADAVINSPGLAVRIKDAWNKAHPKEQMDAATDTTVAMRAWVQKNHQQLVPDFENLLTKQVSEYQAQNRKNIKDLEGVLAGAGLQLFPAGDKWRWGEHWHDGFSSHWFGMGLFAALLTLGSPYWFNMLAKLTSLRPSLAQLIGEEKSKAAKGTNA